NNYYLYPLGDDTKANVRVPASNGSNTAAAASDGGRVEALPVLCVCAENEACSCDKFDDAEYVKGIQKDLGANAGSDGLPKVIEHEGKRTLVVDGTVPKVAGDDKGKLEAQREKQKS